MRPRLLLVTALGASLLAPSACAASPQEPTAGPAPLLAAGRVAGLTEPQRGEWQRYLEQSRARGARDRAALAAEAVAAGLPAPRPAPSHSGFYVTDAMTGAWLASAEAAALADAIVSYQTPAGGWSKRLAFERPRERGQGWTSAGNSGWLGTIDNGATTEQLRFLGRITETRPDARYRAAFQAGLEYLLVAQFPNGCWPQVYPLVGSYHDAATFNDDAIVNVLGVLAAAARGTPAFLPSELRARAVAGFDRGVACILAAQVAVDGLPTIWGQQHDPLTLRPVAARAYEHASLASKESAAIAQLLMSLETPGPRVVAAVHAAAAWFQENGLYGFDYEPGQVPVPRAGAGPLWARFAELGTNRPIFSNRDGIVRYRFDELDAERRSGYAWYTEAPAAALKAYRTWSELHPAGASPR